MVLGPCTCRTTLCENTLSVSGCHGSDTADYFCDGDQLFNSVSTFVYNTDGDRTCNAQGGPTSLSCSCQPRTVSSSLSYRPPVAATSGGFWPIQAGLTYDNHKEYNNNLLEGACKCDIATTSMSGAVLDYYSFGNDSVAAYCDGQNYGYLRSDSRGTPVFHCNFAEDNSSIPGFKLCRCVASTAKNYGADTLFGTAVAGIAPIATRVAALSSSSSLSLSPSASPFTSSPSASPSDTSTGMMSTQPMINTFLLLLGGIWISRAAAWIRSES